MRLERRTLDHRSRTPLPVYGADGLQVTALGVTHGSVPALAYRVEYGGRSLVFSGDQNGDDAQFVDFARGADLLVMAHAVPEDTGPVAARLHALPSEIGTIAQGAGVKHLVLSHLMRRSEQALDQSLGIIRSRYTGPHHRRRGHALLGALSATGGVLVKGYQMPTAAGRRCVAARRWEHVARRAGHCVRR